MKRFILWSFFILVLVSSLALTGCDWNDDDTDNDTATITGVVQASYLKGVNVCVNDECAITDDEGKFTLKDVEIPTTIVLKIGDKVLGTKAVNKNNAHNILITPMVLANDNKTLANYIGALLHSIGGCAISADKCDLSKVKELKIGNDNTASKDNIVEIVKETLAKSDNVSYQYKEGDNGSFTTGIVDKNSAQFYGQATDNGTVNLDNASFLGVSDENKTLSAKYDKKNDNLYINGIKLHLKSIYQNVVFKDDNGSIYFISPNIMIYPYEDVINDEDHASVLFRNYGNSATYENMQEGDYSILSVGTNGIVKAGTAKITKTNNLKGQWTFNSIDKTIIDTDNGTWELSSDLKRVVVTYGDGSQDNSSIFLKPSYTENDRSGFLVLPDTMTNNTDRILILQDVDAVNRNNVHNNIILGLLKKALTADEIIGTYYSYRAKGEDLDIECYGKTTISNQNGKLKFNYQDEWCSDDADLDSISGDIQLNPKIGNSNTELTGFAFVKTGQEGYNILTINSGDIIFYGSGTDNVADASTFLIGTP